MEEVNLKLFGNWCSPFVFRVIWALKLKGIKFEYIEEDIFNKSDLLLHYNPIHKKVPVLVHDGRPISESTVILEYIEETWPDGYPLLPKDPYQRSVSRFWTKFFEDQGMIFWTIFTTQGEEQEKKIKDALGMLKIIEEQAMGIFREKFFGGEMIGMTDLVFGLMAYWVIAIEDAIGIKLIEIQTFPKLHAWTENFKQVPTIKENIYDQEKFAALLKRLREQVLEN